MLLFLGGFFVFSLATCNYYPAVWCDEILYSEPAINLVRHGSYTTDAYEFQPPGTFPIVNCPLYGMSLAPWLAAFGTNLLAVRSFNYALMALGIFLCWSASWRFGLVRSSFLRLLMLLVLCSGYGMSYSYRCSRPDILGMVCLLLLLLAHKIRRPHLRGLCLVGLAAAAPWIGLQVAFYAWIASLAAWAVLRRTGFRELVLLTLGMGAGVAALLLFMYAKGMLPYFLPPVFGIMQGTFYHQAAYPSVWVAVTRFVSQAVGDYVRDFSLLFLLPLLVLLPALAWNRLGLARRRLLIYCLVLVFGAPLLFRVVGHWAFYYSYLSFVPATLAVFAASSELASLRPAPAARWWQPVFAAAVAGAILAGLPLRLALTLTCARLIARDEVRRIVGAWVTSQDVVFGEYMPFFELKGAARVVYHFYSSAVLWPAGIPGFDLPPAQKEAVRVLVIRPSQRERVCAYFGGAWEAVTEPLGDTQDFSKLTRLPVVGNDFARYAAQPQNERYQIQVFRRLGVVPEGPAALMSP